MESSRRSFCFCVSWKDNHFRMAAKSTKQCRHSKNDSSVNSAKRMKKCISRSQRNVHVFNIHVVSILLVSFICMLGCLPIITAEDKEHLCGGRLIDALRFICGSRGIHNPSQRGGLRRVYGGRKVSITQLCCEERCSFKQLERFCAVPRRRSRRTGITRLHLNKRMNGPPTPPHLSSSHSHSRVRYHPRSKQLTPSRAMVRIRNTVATATAKKDRNPLPEKRYKVLVQKRMNQRGNSLMSSLEEIVNVSDFVDGAHEEYMDSSRIIGATLRNLSIPLQSKH